MHRDMERLLRVQVDIFAKVIDVDELHRPGDAALEVAQIDFADGQHGLRDGRQPRALAQLVEQPHGGKLRLWMELDALAGV